MALTWFGGMRSFKNREAAVLFVDDSLKLMVAQLGAARIQIIATRQEESEESYVVVVTPIPSHSLKKTLNNQEDSTST